MSVENITLGEIKQLSNLLGHQTNNKNLDDNFIGKKVIIRTFSAGVHFGTLAEKAGNEVIIRNARRLYYWKTKNNGVSLSEVANAGLDRESKVCSPVSAIWLEAIEIIPCTEAAIKSIGEQNEFKA